MPVSTHPGEILKDELAELGMSANALAITLAVPASRIDQIIKCRRGISPDTAIRLAAYFDGSPEFWLNMQSAFDLAQVEKKPGNKSAA
ncbi:MAG TPA: addiction module antidote protein, HigA family [Rhodospirillales bacterium]|nr:addiction module antidote protein, HigA family [Rhodospirillales bacterium]